LIVRQLKGLQDFISTTVVHYHMGDLGWKFVQSKDELEGADPDTLYHAKHLRDIYFRSQPDYEGRFTVPVLWDKKTESIVNNESRYVLSMMLMKVKSSGCSTLNSTRFFLPTNRV
jgi:putative glutathione S-transferase